MHCTSLLPTEDFKTNTASHKKNVIYHSFRTGQHVLRNFFHWIHGILLRLAGYYAILISGYSFIRLENKSNKKRQTKTEAKQNTHTHTTPRISPNPGNLRVMPLGERCGRCVMQAFQVKIAFSDLSYIMYYYFLAIWRRKKYALHWNSSAIISHSYQCSSSKLAIFCNFQNSFCCSLRKKTNN